MEIKLIKKVCLWIEVTDSFVASAACRAAISMMENYFRRVQHHISKQLHKIPSSLKFFNQIEKKANKIKVSLVK